MLNRSNCRAQALRAIRDGAAKLRTRTEALKLLLRVCLRSHLRREPGRWPCVSLFFSGESRLRFAGPGSHSPPRWRTRERRSDFSDSTPSGAIPPVHCWLEFCFWTLPFARKERFWGLIRPAMLRLALESTRAHILSGAVRTSFSLRHTEKNVLAEPSYNNKNSMTGQCFRLRI
jgi:hypothetical protein